MASPNVSITLTTVTDGGYILVRRTLPLQTETHRQAFGWTEEESILAVLRQMLAEIAAERPADD